MTSGPDSRSGGTRAALRSDRRELTLALLLGAAGACVAYLASRQGWAQVKTIPPKPLPASQVTVTGSALVPYSGALAVAGLATLAAVLASRGLARRLTGVLLALIGASLAASAFTVTKAAAISAASSNVGPATAGAGSVTGGNGQASSIPNVAGTAPHVAFSAGGWQVMVVVGALAMIAAGALVVWRANNMAVMSGRYESPSGEARPGRPGRVAGASRQPPARLEPAASLQLTASPEPTASVQLTASPELGAQRSAGPKATSARVATPSDSGSIWDALSRGDDPTAADIDPQKA